MKTRGRLWLGLAILVAAVLLGLHWLGDGRARGAPIRVAFAGPTSGSSAEDGLAAVRAIELVFERANAEGGVDGRPLLLDVYDDRNDPAQARANAPRIAEQAETVAVIGHNYSTSSIAAGRIYAERGIPAIASAATSIDVTRGNPWYFRTIYNDRDQGRLVLLYIAEVLGAARIGIVHETEAYGAYLTGVMEDAAREMGVDVAAAWGFDPDDPQLDARLDRIAARIVEPGGPRLVVLAVQPEAGIALVRRLRDAGYPGTLVVTDALASQAFAEGFHDLPDERARPGRYTDGIYASTPFLFDSAGRAAGEFLAAYAARYEHPPTWYAAFAADAASVIVAALRRADISPAPSHIAADRAALRDALAAIGPLDAFEGVTGPTYFDAEGDAQKPVPMGRFLDGEIVSSYSQLLLVPGVHKRAEVGPRLDPERVAVLGDRVLYRKDVARVGVRVDRFSDIDFDQGVFGLDFHIWFRHRGDQRVEEVVFTNAVEPIALGDPVDELVAGEQVYRLYHVHGRFRSDTVPAGYGRHALALSFHHRDRTRDDLVYAIDSVGMNLVQRRAQKARELLEHNDWTIDDLFFFEDEVEESALGHPQYLSSGKIRSFSQLNIGVTLRRQAKSLRELLPTSEQRLLLGIGVGGSLLLLLLPGGLAPRLVWLLQAGCALLTLMAAEPLIGNWLQPIAEPAQLARLSRAFDLLWWVVPAVLLVLAIDRFVWRPAAERTGRPIPTLLRWSAAFVVYLLALFGIVAFVYDYRLTGLLATSGVLAMVIGLAVQLNITNVFAGVALNIERPFRVGDWIMIHGRTPEPDESVIGQVIDINWRTTRLRTADDTVIVIPNGVLSEKTITNFSAPHETTRFQLSYTIDHAVPSEKVLEVIRNALDVVKTSDGVGGVLAEPPPKVRISRVTETGVEYLVRYRILPSELSPIDGQHLVNEAVLHRLHEAGIELAYPKRRIHNDRPVEGSA